MLSLLADGLRELGLEASQQQLERFETYYNILTDWSERVNLTAIRDEEGVQRRHFLESAALIPLLEQHGRPLRDGSLIDVGSGAGVPGVPLKILEPRLRLTLVESKQRKAEFLRALISALGLRDVAVVPRRAEEAAHDPDHREQYDFAAAKALAPLRTLVELTLPFVRVGGLVLAPKGGEAKPARRRTTKTRAVPSGPLAAEDGLASFHATLTDGEPWYPALLDVIGRWAPAEETVRGQRFLYMIAGEVSGDAIGGALIAALKRQLGGRVRFAGVGGPVMGAEGLDSFRPPLGHPIPMTTVMKPDVCAVAGKDGHRVLSNPTQGFPTSRAPVWVRIDGGVAVHPVDDRSVKCAALGFGISPPTPCESRESRESLRS